MGSFLGTLRRDVRGNTLAMMAAALFPITALTGSAVDTARLYVVKVRLQQACDAGVLAGRKFMASSTSTTLDANATTQATTFFNNNFRSGWLNTSNVTFTPSKTVDNQVAGTAQATVPMVVMTIFGVAPQVLGVTCQARYDVADSDVMFVLDTTGSMACAPSDPDNCGQSTVSYTYNGQTSYKVQEKSNSRISALRSAVLSFYDTVASSADASTHFRYGFVPYTSTVNAGAAVTSLSSNYMVQKWNYDTRHVVGDHNQGNSSNYGSQTGVTQATCAGYNGYRNPTTGYTTSGTATVYSTTWSPANNGTCSATQQTVTPVWRYENWALDVSQFIPTLANGTTIPDPTKITGATTAWQGCLEERDTTVASSFDPTNLPPDLDPDLKPTTDNTRWRPMWPDVIYYRGGNTTVDDYGNSSNPYGDSSNNFQFGGASNGYLPGGYLTCGKPVKRLQTMSRDDVNNYVNAPDFVPWGGTYHDTGMIWGTRMLSPGGIFAGDTAAWPGRNVPNRYIVFMTDGHMATNQYIYGMYGWENYDQRTTGGNFSNSDSYHNARFLAECQAAKNRNIKVYVVSLAATLDSNLTSCASPNSAYFASDSASLTTAFQTIAKQVAMLRISQ